MFKRISCFMLAMAMLFSLTACEKAPVQDSHSSAVLREENILGEDVTVNGTTGSDTTNTSNGVAVVGGNAAEMKKNLDFGGKKIVIMRENDIWAKGQNTAWDNFLNWMAKVEKKFNVDIEVKKWNVPLAGEMLAGVQPEGHYYAVGYTGGGNIYDMASKGYLATLDSAMEKTGITMREEQYSDVNTSLSMLNGHQYSIGFGFSRIQSTILYNKKLLAQAGYKDSTVQNLIKNKKWTWDKVTEIGKKTTKRNASGEVTQWGIGFADSYDTAVKGMVLSNGGHLIHPDESGKYISHFNSQNTTEALQQVYKWFNVDKIATNFSGGQWGMGDSYFAQNKVAIYFCGHQGAVAAYSNLTADDYGVAYLPLGPRMNNYVAYMTHEYRYVIPACYQNMTTELLLLADELHYWPVEGYTRENAFRDEWAGYFRSKEQYDMWYNHHFSKDVTRVWEGSDMVGIGSADLGELINGKKTATVWADANHKAFDTSVDALAEKYKYTGFLK